MPRFASLYYFGSFTSFKIILFGPERTVGVTGNTVTRPEVRYKSVTGRHFPHYQRLKGTSFDVEIQGNVACRRFPPINRMRILVLFEIVAFTRNLA